MSTQNRLSRKSSLVFIIVGTVTLMMVSLLFGYSLRLMGTWFTSNFANNVAIVSSFALVFASLAVSLICIIFYRKYILSESALEHPEAIEKQDYPQWARIAKKIKLKNNDIFYIMFLCLPPLYGGWVVLSTIFWILGGFLKNYSNFINHLAVLQQVFLVGTLIIIIPAVFTLLTMFVLLLVTSNAMVKYLRYPSDEDFVFAESFLIANSLANQDRKGAQGEVPLFVNSLTRYSRNYLNPKRKSYSQEFSDLRKNKTAISRLILFAPEELIGSVQDLFLKFGLALMNWDDPSCFNALELLIRYVDDYKPVGRLQKLRQQIETYPREVYAVVVVIIVVGALLGIPQLLALL